MYRDCERNKGRKAPTKNPYRISQNLKEKMSSSKKKQASKVCQMIKEEQSTPEFYSCFNMLFLRRDIIFEIKLMQGEYQKNSLCFQST